MGAHKGSGASVKACSRKARGTNESASGTGQGISIDVVTGAEITAALALPASSKAFTYSRMPGHSNS